MVAEALLCLALNIYHEARDQSTRGQEAVAVVTLNRANYQPDEICTTVFSPKQFSWTPKFSGMRTNHSMEKLHKLIPTDSEAWQIAKRIARLALAGEINSPARDALYFYNPNIANPIWKNRQVVARIDDHVFLK